MVADQKANMLYLINDNFDGWNDYEDSDSSDCDYEDWLSPEFRKEKVRELGFLVVGKTDWIEYREKFEILHLHLWYEDDGKKLFLECIGGKATKLLRSLLKPQTLDNSTLDSVLEAFETHFYPVKDQAYYISKLTVRKQRPSESFFDYVVVLRNLISSCKIGRRKHSKLRNQIFAGAEKTVKMLFKPNSSLSEIFEIGLLVDHMKFDKNRWNRKTLIKRNMVGLCYRCTLNLKDKHADVTCPFDWAICSSCKVKGHVSLGCKYKDVTCHNCSEVGHVAKLCKKPKKSVEQDSVVDSKAS